MSAIIHVVGAAIVRGTHCLAARRGPAMSPPRAVWEFPGGKVEPGEAPEHALAREIREELQVDIEVGQLLGTSHVSLADGRHVRLDVYLAALSDPRAEVAPLEHDAVRWLAHHEIERLEWAEADVPLLPVIQTHLWCLDQS